VQSAVSTIDLGVGITVDNLTPTTGSTVTYTITTSNAGPSNATGVLVNIPLPAGVTYVSDTGSGAYVTATNTWTIGTINAGVAGPTLMITVTVDATSGQPVTANIIISGNESDTDPSNDNDDVTFTVP